MFVHPALQLYNRIIWITGYLEKNMEWAGSTNVVIFERNIINMNMGILFLLVESGRGGEERGEE